MTFKLKHQFIRLISLALLVTMMAIPTYAACPYEITNLHTDAASGWTMWDHRHIPSRSTSFRYADDGITDDYRSYVEDGIALWGTTLSCTESESGIGLITSNIMYGGDATAATLSEYDSSRHVTSWSITIYPSNFEELPSASKIRTIAHEIGHVFGLHHVDNSRQLMYGYASTTKDVTWFERWGIYTLTHTHVHNDETTYAIEQHSVTQHRRRCETCYAFYLVDCTYTSQYHSGNYHYFQMACSCGNSGRKQILCSTLTCPYTQQEIM